MLSRQRYAVEWGVSQRRRNRAAASLRDKLAVRYVAAIRIAAISEWLPERLRNRT